MTKKFFKSGSKKIPLPIFFPDATRAVVRSVDSSDLKKTKTLGILVNTFHLYRDLEKKVLREHGGVRSLMSFQGGAISDSGGFQVMSIIKNNPDKGKVIDKGILLKTSKKRTDSFTPEKSIAFQIELKTDMLIVLDDFTPPKAKRAEAKKTVERTILWAQRSKKEFLRQLEIRRIKEKDRPYLLGVVQGGKYQDLREYCVKELVKIGFDGLGYGGWPLNEKGDFDYLSAQTIAKNCPSDYFLYGLGIGKPDEIVNLVKLGFNIFDCVLPTRDARHKRLYVFNANSIEDINLNQDKFYSYFVPNKEKYSHDVRPVSQACDCLLCQNYTRAYLAHLFKIEELTAKRLATIHNLRFYSLLMEKLVGEHLKGN